MEGQEQQEQLEVSEREGEEYKGANVPWDRFQTIVSKNGKLAHQLREAKAELVTLSERGATVDTVTRELEMARTRIASMSADTDLNMALAERGLDADGRSIIKMLHSNLPEDGRPGVLEWHDLMRDDASKRPKPMLGYFDAPQPMDKVDAPDPAPKSKPKMPRSSRHSGGSGTGNADVTAAQIREAREAAMQSGHWDKVKAMMAEYDSQRSPG